MVRFTGGFLLFSAFSRATPTHRTDQVVLRNPQQSSTQPRKLQGRFLHITDFHPDPFYKVHSNPDSEHPCHKGSGKGNAGYYGAEITNCDSPLSLMNATFDWIDKNIKDDIDFVVWTGDSARHDNDEQYPRRDKQVEESNRYLVHKFAEVFGKNGHRNDPNPSNDFVIPIVPTFGNNDILPHNIFTPGPNRWTRKFEDIWQNFVPQAQKHSFARGGWFFTEVIPNRLAVFSLNTLYFFESNSAVDGCDAKSEPGYEHFEWLRIQLEFLRQRGMKAILTGHVPPAMTESKQNWDNTCHQKYILWLRQYRDVIVGSIYGHMNIDHFMFQDVLDLKYKFKIDGITKNGLGSGLGVTPISNDADFSIAGKKNYLKELRDFWSQLPTPPFESFEGDDVEELTKKKSKKSKKKKMKKYLKKIGGPYGERFSLSVVSPSVVPNFYPTLRIIEYNITGLEHDHPATELIGTPAEGIAFPSMDKTIVDSEDMVVIDKKKKKKKKKGKKKKPNFHVPTPPSSASPPGPAYSPQTLSFLSWTQFYANLTTINARVKKEGIDADEKKKLKHFKYEVEYSTNTDGMYNMTDLTMRSWLDLAERMGRDELVKSSDEETNKAVSLNDDNETEKRKKKEKGSSSTKHKNHMWMAFVKRAYVGTMDEAELDDSFG